MAVHANYTTFLPLAFILMISKYSVAHSLKLSNELEGHPQLEPEEDAIRMRKVDYEVPNDISPRENKANDFPVLQKRDIPINNGIISQSMAMTGGRIDISNMSGVTIRARNSENQLRVSIHNNELFVADEVVCDDINKQLDEATYQKTPDGTHWYTNINVGEPMTQAEIGEFKTEWAQYEKEREEKRKQRETERRQHEKQREEERKKYIEQKNAERRQREEEQERQRKEKYEERKKQRQEREAERRQIEEEREKQRKRRDEERRQQREAEKRQREEDLERRRKAAKEEWERELKEREKRKKGKKADA